MNTFLRAVLFLLPVCGNAAALSKEQAIAYASTVAKKNGVDLLQFSSPTAYYEPEYKRNEWLVCYKALTRSQDKASFYVILNDAASVGNALLTFGPCE